MVLNILMAVAQWEREAIGERTRDALAFKRASGLRSGPIPYGQRLDPDGLLPIPRAKTGELAGLYSRHSASFWCGPATRITSLVTGAALWRRSATGARDT